MAAYMEEYQDAYQSFLSKLPEGADLSKVEYVHEYSVSAPKDHKIEPMEITVCSDCWLMLERNDDDTEWVHV